MRAEPVLHINWTCERQDRGGRGAEVGSRECEAFRTAAASAWVCQSAQARQAAGPLERRPTAG